MTYAAHAKDFACIDDKARPQAQTAPKKPGFLRRFFEVFVESRQREADRQIARFLARSGGRFTDAIERELMERLASSNWNAQR